MHEYEFPWARRTKQTKAAFDFWQMRPESLFNRPQIIRKINSEESLYTAPSCLERRLALARDTAPEIKGPTWGFDLFQFAASRRSADLHDNARLFWTAWQRYIYICISEQLFVRYQTILYLCHPDCIVTCYWCFRIDYVYAPFCASNNVLILPNKYSRTIRCFRPIL